MTDVLFYVLMLLAAGAALFTQGLSAAAREHVRAHYPDWFDRLSAGGGFLRMSRPEDRARRRLMRPLLLGALPPETAGDEMLALIARRMRLSMLGVAVGLLGVVAVIAVRAQAA